MISLETDVKKLTYFLSNISGESDVFPPIIVKNPARFAEMLILYGKAITSVKQGELDGIIGYFPSRNILRVDLLWTAPQRIYSSPLYPLLNHTVRSEWNFHGKIEITVEKVKKGVIEMLTGIGFELKKEDKFQNDIGKNYLILENNFGSLKKYFPQ
ncbi:MAG: hypothetical protein WD876_02215 [Candidatus Pacearchaeota archaeon]